MSQSVRPSGAGLVATSVIGSALLAVGLAVVARWSGSQLVLAQAADSTSDALAGTMLALAARTSGRDPDPAHPRGHRAAEPIAALVVAVLAGVLATEVARSAIETLVSGERAVLGGAALAGLGIKMALKTIVVVLARRLDPHRASPVLDALRIDAQNDVLVGVVSIAGLLLASRSLPALDGVLALGVAAYVAFSGVRLARDNVVLLMGASAPSERVSELREKARAVDGVRAIGRLIATFHGAVLHVEVDVGLDAALSLAEAHRIAHAVEAVMLAEPDVERAVIHVEPAPLADAR